MYGDTMVMRRRAGALREQATDLRAMADRLVGQADAIAWTGRAADAMRERIRERSSHLREVAAGHDAAADSLEIHLAEVDRLTDAIADLEHRARSLQADGALSGFTPPPSGHRDWLTVTLPEALT